jgi:hypothetical protein
MRFAILVVNICIHNHLSKKFRNEDQGMVVVLVEAQGMKQGKLWRLQKWT